MAHNSVPSKKVIKIASSSGKKLFVSVFLVLLIGIVSAHDVDYKEKFSETKYFERDNVVVSRTVWADYDNEDRYSTYDYRHGYSYRDSRDYFERMHEDLFYGNRYSSRDNNYHRGMYYGSSPSGRYYEYVPHLRSYEGRDCYVTPPADRLFYIKC